MSTPASAVIPPNAAFVPPVPPPGGYAWQRFLDVKNASNGEYHMNFNPQLLEVLREPPKRLLDVGCASGILGNFVKQKFGAVAMGIEPNVAAAEVAKTRLDKVLVGKLEDFDLVAEGIPLGSLDTIVAADVLEHMYDPWATMVHLKKFMTPEGQFIISVPNTRHIHLLAKLIDGGAWTYEERGLLDITHIRFFTLKEITNLLAETGYLVERVAYFVDPSFEEFYNRAKDQPQINLRVGRLALDGISQQELTELCTWQFFIRAKPLF
jgi:O-antigen biosynthesis protein